MKAKELNGTHLGQHVTIKVGSASITDTIRGYSASADLIQDGPFFAQLSTRPTYVLGRQTLAIDFLTAGTIQVDPDTVVVFQAEAAPSKRGAHHLSEDHNGDPICNCGWDPSRIGVRVTNREDARQMIRMHIADTKEAAAHGQ